MEQTNINTVSNSNNLMLRLLTKLMIFLGVMVVLAIAVLLTFGLYPYKTIEVYNAPVAILNNIPLRAGERLYYDIYYCKFTDKPAMVTRVLRGTNGFTFGSVPQRGAGAKTIVGQDGKSACSKENPIHSVSGSYQLPEDIPAGEYKIRTILEYQVNPFRVIPYSFDSQVFNVEDGKGKPTRPPYSPPASTVIAPPKQEPIVLQPVEPAPVTDTTPTVVLLTPVAQASVDTNKEEVKLEVKLPNGDVVNVGKERFCLPVIGCVIN